MPNYKYKCIPVPMIISTGPKVKNLQKAAVENYEQLLNAETAGGWEFDSIDTVTTHQPAGCLASMFGGSGETVTFKIMIFRMEI